eukprot:COSAG01_NODE_2130_length_8363_cov_5.120523_10_plen_104_part_00
MFWLRAEVVLSGVAYSGGSGQRIASVEATADSGKTWHAMTIRISESEVKDDSSRHWHWVRWAGDIPVVADQTEEQAPLQVWCRAFQEDGKHAAQLPPSACLPL